VPVVAAGWYHSGLSQPVKGIDGFLKPPQTQARSVPTIIHRSKHNISRANISPNALKVLYRLKGAGHMAFLVGGSVRDLLLGGQPKDFDVATDADPQQIRAAFRNCRLVGRRFRLAHIRFGREIIEVATFRASASDDGDDRSVHDDMTGRILRDNVYGSIDQDVLRRDFTANALYYNIADFSVWDYTNGVAHIEQRLLQLLGDPVTRYREDPVRMLRAVRFAAKLDFQIAPDTAAPLRDMGAHLADVPPARLFDECLKIFHCGHSARALQLLFEYELFAHLFPATQEALNEDPDGYGKALLQRGLENTDERIAADKPTTPMFSFAVLLWPAIHRLASYLETERQISNIAAINEACGEVVHRQLQRITVPRRFTTPMREMLAMQPRFSNRRGGRALSFLSHRRFRAAYDFMLLRSECGQVDPEIAEFWTKVQDLTEAEQRDAFGADGQKASRPRRKRRRRPRTAQQPSG
jgi:poly(A) polymerase